MAILVQRSRRPRRWAGVALFALLLLAAWWQRNESAVEWPVADAGILDDPTRAPEAFASAAPAHNPVVPTAPESDPTLTHPPAAIVAPEGMTTDEWHALHDALKDHPQRDAEIARVAEYMAYRARLERYRVLQTQGAVGQGMARELAPALLDGLPARVARGEVTAAEALRLQDSLLATLWPDGTARDMRRAIERQRLRDAAPPLPDMRAQAERDARFQREQAAIVAAWQALPAQDRDRRRLEADIDALRRSIYDTPDTGGKP